MLLSGLLVGDGTWEQRQEVWDWTSPLAVFSAPRTIWYELRTHAMGFRGERSHWHGPSCDAGWRQDGLLATRGPHNPVENLKLVTGAAPTNNQSSHLGLDGDCVP